MHMRDWSKPAVDVFLLPLPSILPLIHLELVTHTCAGTPTLPMHTHPERPRSRVLVITSSPHAKAHLPTQQMWTLALCRPA
jgi:hypothetical protein